MIDNIAPNQPAPNQPQAEQPITYDQWKEIVRKRYQIAPDVWRTLTATESGHDPNATSPTGVRGEFQVTKKTARGFNLNRDDPYQQVVAAAKTWRQAYDSVSGLYDNEDERNLAARAVYFNGPGAIDRKTGNFRENGKNIISVGQDGQNFARNLNRSRAEGYPSIDWNAVNSSYRTAPQPGTAPGAPGVQAPQSGTAPAQRALPGTPAQRAAIAEFEQQKARTDGSNPASLRALQETARRIQKTQPGLTVFMPENGWPSLASNDQALHQYIVDTNKNAWSARGNLGQSPNALTAITDRALQAEAGLQLKREQLQAQMKRPVQLGRPGAITMPSQTEMRAAEDTLQRIQTPQLQRQGSGFVRDAATAGRNAQTVQDLSDAARDSEFSPALMPDAAGAAKFGRALTNVQQERTLDRIAGNSAAARARAEQVRSFEESPITRGARALTSLSPSGQFMDFLGVKDYGGTLADQAMTFGRAAAEGTVDVAEGIGITAAGSMPQPTLFDTPAVQKLMREAPANLLASLNQDLGFDAARRAINGALPDDPRRAGFGKDLAQGAGSAVPFMAAALLTRGGSLAAGITGSLSTATQFYKDAKANGADDDTAIASGRVGALFGILEAAGLGRAIDRIGAKQAILERALQMAEEGGQEALSEFLQNVNARILTAYDPERGLDENVLKSGLIGALIGGGAEVVGEGVSHIQEGAAHRQNMRAATAQEEAMLAELEARQKSPTTEPGAGVQPSAPVAGASASPSVSPAAAPAPGSLEETMQKLREIVNPPAAPKADRTSTRVDQTRAALAEAEQLGDEKVIALAREEHARALDALAKKAPVAERAGILAELEQVRPTKTDARTEIEAQRTQAKSAYEEAMLAGDRAAAVQALADEKASLQQSLRFQPQTAEDVRAAAEARNRIRAIEGQVKQLKAGGAALEAERRKQMQAATEHEKDMLRALEQRAAARKADEKAAQKEATAPRTLRRQAFGEAQKLATEARANYQSAVIAGDHASVADHLVSERDALQRVLRLAPTGEVSETELAAYRARVRNINEHLKRLRPATKGGAPARASQGDSWSLSITNPEGGVPQASSLEEFFTGDKAKADPSQRLSSFIIKNYGGLKMDAKSGEWQEIAQRRPGLVNYASRFGPDEIITELEKEGFGPFRDSAGNPDLDALREALYQDTVHKEALRQTNGQTGNVAGADLVPAEERDDFELEQKLLQGKDGDAIEYRRAIDDLSEDRNTEAAANKLREIANKTGISEDYTQRNVDALQEDAKRAFGSFVVAEGEAAPAAQEVGEGARYANLRAAGRYPDIMGSGRNNRSEVELQRSRISALLPFNIQGNKMELLAKGLDQMLITEAQRSERTIDAFAGAATYTHVLRRRGAGHEGDILNEFDPLRYITHKQLRDNPEAVAKAAEAVVAELKEMTATIPDNAPWREEFGEIRARVTDFFRRKLLEHVAPGQDLDAKAKSGDIVEMQDTPELAGLYIVLQNSTFRYLPVQAEVGPSGFKVAGFGIVAANKDTSIPEGSRVAKFAIGGRQILKARDFILPAGARFQGLDVRRGDGWALIREEAGAGDLVPVDTSYLNQDAAETSNYNKATAEDAVPEVYMQKVQENLLPAWERGAKLLITNNWSQTVADYLEGLGFRIYKDFRKGAAEHEAKSGGAAELIAINFDRRTGDLLQRSGDVVPGQLAGRAAQTTDDAGSDAAGARGAEGLDAGAAPENDAVRGLPAAGRADAARPEVAASEAELARRARVLVRQREKMNERTAIYEKAKQRTKERTGKESGEFGKLTSFMQRELPDWSADVAAGEARPTLPAVVDAPEWKELLDLPAFATQQDVKNAIAQDLAGMPRMSDMDVDDWYRVMDEHGGSFSPAVRQSLANAIASDERFERRLDKFVADEEVERQMAAMDAMRPYSNAAKEARQNLLTYLAEARINNANEEATNITDHWLLQQTLLRQRAASDDATLDREAGTGRDARGANGEGQNVEPGSARAQSEESGAPGENVAPKAPGAPVTYQVFRGVSGDGKPNDAGAFGKGEYWSGRRTAAEAYAVKGGKVVEGEVSLQRPLVGEYQELRDLQRRLYGRMLTGFEPELSEKFDQYLRAQGYDGVVVFDPEMSTTVPEEVVKLAPRKAEDVLIKPEEPAPKSTKPAADRSISQLRGELERGRQPVLNDGERKVVEARLAKYEAMNDDRVAADIAELRLLLGGTTTAERQALVDTPAFQEWFGQSKVVDEQGKPMVVYHGTTTDFDEFKADDDIGFHFGTTAAAEERLAEKKGEGAPHIMPVYLSIQKPLTVNEDLFADGYVSELLLAEALRDAGVITAAQFAEFTQNPDSAYRIWEPFYQAGYDGIKYRNEIEDKGSWSWLAFKPQQVKSAFSAEINPASPKLSEPKIVSEARARLREQNRTLGAGLDPRYVLDQLLVTGYDFYRVTKNAAAWTKAMIAKFGEEIKPHLEELRTRIGDALEAAGIAESKPDVDKYGYYSQLARVVDAKMQAKASGDQLLAMLKNPNSGVKEEELKWSGLDDFLAGRKSVTKQEVQDYLAQNAVRLEEVVKGERVMPDYEKNEEGLERFAKEVAGNPKYWQEVVPDHAFDSFANDAERVDFLASDEIFALDWAFTHGLAPTNPTRHHTWVVPGAAPYSYRELLLTLPNPHQAEADRLRKKLSEDAPVLRKRAQAAAERATEKLQDFERQAREENGGDVRVGTWPPEVQAEHDKLYREAERLTKQVWGDPPELHQLQIDLDNAEYRASHFPRFVAEAHFYEPNVLAHVRFNDRTDSSGQRVLFLEEIQSDWHQKGRRDGYRQKWKKEDVDKIRVLPEPVIPDSYVRDITVHEVPFKEAVTELYATLDGDGKYVLRPRSYGYESRFHIPAMTAAELPAAVGEQLARRIIEQVKTAAPPDAADYSAWVGFPNLNEEIAIPSEPTRFEVRSPKGIIGTFDTEQEARAGLMDYQIGYDRYGASPVPEMPGWDVAQDENGVWTVSHDGQVIYSDTDTTRDAILADAVRAVRNRSSWTVVDGDGKVLASPPKYLNKTPEDALRVVQESALRGDLDSLSRVPDAPFKKNWHELAFKRMLQYAAAHGYDKIAWTTGEQQAARYDLSQHVSQLEYKSDFADGKPTGTYTVRALSHRGHGIFMENNLTPARLSEIVGKDITDKIVGDAEAHDPARTEMRVMSGVDLKVGGEGMKGFYDKILPTFVNKYAKKWGAKAGMLHVKGGRHPIDAYGVYPNHEGEYVIAMSEEGGGDFEDTFYPTRREAEAALDALKTSQRSSVVGVHGMEITPEMRSSVLLEGQSLFSGVDPFKAAQSLKKLAQDVADKLERKGILARKDDVDKYGFFSQLARTVRNKMPEKASAAQVLGILKNPSNSVKPAELEWSGIEEWLAGKDTVTKQEVQDFIAQNAVRLQEIEKGYAKYKRDQGGFKQLIHDAANDEKLWSEVEFARAFDSFPDEAAREGYAFTEGSTAATNYLIRSEEGLGLPKFEQYRLSGSEVHSYRELLLTLPSDRPLQRAKITQASGGYRIALGNQTARAESREVAEAMARQMESDPQNTSHQSGVYRSSHWDEPNVLAHVRFDSRTDADGKKVLHVAEIQSDWHQAGRKKGYKVKDVGRLQKAMRDAMDEREAISRQMKDVATELTAIRNDMKTASPRFVIRSAEGAELYRGDSNVEAGKALRSQEGAWEDLDSLPKYPARFHELRALDQELNQKWEAADARVYEADRQINTNDDAVPDAPFKKTWYELAFKRVLRYAAEHGFERVTWDTGQVNADRYDLSQHLDRIEYEPTEEGNYEFIAFDKNGNSVIHEDEIDLARIEELAGKEITEKIQNDAGEPKADSPYRDWRVLSGLDLKVGGEGMIGFYDKILPAFVNKYVKKWGASVGEGLVSGTGKEPRVVNDAPFTPRDREILGRTFADSSSWREALENLKQKMPDFSALARMEEEARSANFDTPLYKPAANAHAVHSIDITPSMRESVEMEGQSLFSDPFGVGAAVEVGKKITKKAKARKNVSKLSDAEVKSLASILPDKSQALPDVQKYAQEAARKLLQAAEDGTLPHTRMIKIYDKLNRKRANTLREKQAKFFKDAAARITEFAAESQALANVSVSDPAYKEIENRQRIALLKLKNELSKAGEYTSVFELPAKIGRAMLLATPHILLFNVANQVSDVLPHELSKLMPVPQKSLRAILGDEFEAPTLRGEDMVAGAKAVLSELRSLLVDRANSNIAQVFQYGESTLLADQEIAIEAYKNLHAGNIPKSLQGGAEKFEMGNRLKGLDLIGEAVTIIHRAHGAADVPGRRFAYTTALTALARQQAVKIADKAGWAGAERAKYVHELMRQIVANPAPNQILVAAMEANNFVLDVETSLHAGLQALRDKLSGETRLRKETRPDMSPKEKAQLRQQITQMSRYRWGNALVNKLIIDTFVPFTKIPTAAAVAKFYRYTPLALFASGMKLRAMAADKRAGFAVDPLSALDAYRNVQKGAFGTVTLMLAGTLFAFGMASLIHSDDNQPQMRAVLEALGYDFQPELKMGEAAISTKATGTVGGQLAALAKGQSAFRERLRGDGKPDSLADRSWRSAFAFGKAVATDTPLGRAMFDVTGGINSASEGRVDGSAIARTAAQRLQPGILRDVAQTVDDKRRVVDTKSGNWETFKQTYQAGIPGLRENLPARLDTLGREQTQASPFKIARPAPTVDNQATLERLAAEGIGLPTLRRKPDESLAAFQARQRSFGAQAEETLRRLQQIDFTGVPDGVRRRVVNDLLTKDGVERASILAPKSLAAEVEIEAKKMQDWEQVVADPRYQKLSPEQRTEARKRFVSEYSRWKSQVSEKTGRETRRAIPMPDALRKVAINRSLQ